MPHPGQNCNQACALIRNQTRDLSICRRCPTTEPHPPGQQMTFFHCLLPLLASLFSKCLCTIHLQAESCSQMAGDRGMHLGPHNTCAMSLKRCSDTLQPLFQEGSSPEVNKGNCCPAGWRHDQQEVSPRCVQDCRASLVLLSNALPTREVWVQVTKE